MPSPVFGGQVPYRVLFPNKSLFPVEPQVLESICYARDVQPFITKLDINVLKCIFLGYSRLQKDCWC